MKYNLIWIAILMMGLMVACDDDEDSPAANEVTIVDNEFLPDDLTVTAGTQVRWVNEGDVDHTVTSADGLFNEYLEPGEEFTYTFVDSGTYPYVCTIHAGMDGVINVQ